MVFPMSSLGWPKALTLFGGYLLLDWISYLHPLHGLGITPWNPAPALALVFLLRHGKWAGLPLFVAIVVAESLLRAQPLPAALQLGLAAVLTAGYGAIAEVLRRHLRRGELFSDRLGLARWAVTIAVGMLVNSTLFGGLLGASGHLAWNELPEAIGRHWVGDMVGALVSMPLFWMLSEQRGRFQLRAIVMRREALVHLALTAAALWIAFGLGSSADFKYLYFLFLPIVWASVRQGLAGAVVAAAVVQVGIIVAVQALGMPSVNVVETQTLAVAIALVGFFIGIVVDEEKRVSAELRQTMRLAAAGEMAGALAHELSQPITALSAYGAACEALIQHGGPSDQLRDTIGRMIGESVRAAEVVRRLRDFFRTGATQLERVRVDTLVRSALGPFAGRAATNAIRLEVGTLAATHVMADRLQLEVVVRNLLSNAFESVQDCTPERRVVRISAIENGEREVLVTVEDSGPGVALEVAGDLFEPFRSSKPSGLGLGLAISRAIVETHGGQLWAEVGDRGVFRMSLPTDDESSGRPGGKETPRAPA